MLLTLNSADQDNYQFTNSLQETLLLKKGTVIRVKNIKIEKAFQVQITAPDNVFQLKFDDATNQPVNFVIPSGLYSLKSLEDALNDSYDQSIYNYNIQWVITPQNYQQSQGIVELNIYGYQTPNPTGFKQQLFLTTSLVNSQNSSVSPLGEIAKTNPGDSLTDNYFYYKAALNLKDVGITRPPQGGPSIPSGLSYCRFEFSLDGPIASDVRFAFVNQNWNGDISDGVIKSVFCVDIVGADRRIIVYENNNVICDFSDPTIGVNAGNSLSPGRSLILRAYSPLTGLNPQQKKWYGGFYIGTRAGQNNPRTLTDYYSDNVADERYYIQSGDILYPVFINLNNQSKFTNINANLIESKPPLSLSESNSIVEHDFQSIAECTISTSDIITASPTGAFTCGVVSQTEYTSSHHVFSVSDKTKQFITGHFSEDTLTDLSTCIDGYEFNNGNIRNVSEGQILPTIVATYNNNDTFRLNKSNNEVFLEKSIDSGATYTIIHMPVFNGFHEDTTFVKFLFPSVANSTGSYITLIEQALFNNFLALAVGSTGKYVEFITNTSGLGAQLGFQQPNYVFDATVGSFPFKQIAEDVLDFNVLNTNLRDSFRIQLPNLPIKSYNGKTGFSDKTICTLDVSIDGVVSYPHEMKVECLNDYDIPLSEIQCQITDEDNNLATSNFLGDCQIALEFTPHLAI